MNSYVEGQLCLYEKGPAGWNLVKQLGFDIQSNMGLVEAKAHLKSAFSQLEGCEVFLLKELRGWVYLLLQEMRFRIWKSEGKILEQMDHVAQKEEEVRTIVQKPIPTPLPIGNTAEGRYRINLIEVMKSDPTLNSKQLLMPFMAKGGFQKLEILCEHIPRWFPMECERLNLSMESGPDVSCHGVKVIVQPNNRKLPA